MMCCMKLSVNLLIVVAISMMTSATASRRGEKIHFQDSSEMAELDIDKRPGPYPDNRNHRGRAVGHQKQHNLPEFEQGIPGVYPIRGPAQAPIVLPSPGEKASELQNQQQKVQLPVGHHYAGNPFLSKLLMITSTTTMPIANKYNPPVFPGVTNQLPSSDKPLTTTPSSFNPRRTNLLYGSNLLEEDAKRDSKAEESTDVSFIDRGLFDTAPHCQAGQILVNNKCRMAV